MICSKCGQDKPESEISRHRGCGKKNRTRLCRSCVNSQRSARRAAYTAAYNAGTVESVLCIDCGETRPRGHWCINRCRPCLNAYHVKWRSVNPLSAKSAWAKFNAKNRADQNARDIRNAKARNRYASNPEPLRLKAHNRRAMEAAVGGVLTSEEWAEILSVFDHRCAYCLERSDALEKDHVIALTRGGSNDADNIVPACRACNSRKKNHPVWHILRYAA